MGQEGRMKEVETGRERGFKVKVGRVKGEKGEKLTIVHRKGGGEILHTSVFHLKGLENFSLSY